MALHRDIYWVGRQWAVTGYGIQACNQKQKSQFDIEASRIWEDGVLDSIRAEPWLNLEDFEKALVVARERFPQPPQKTTPLQPSVVSVVTTVLKETELKESPSETSKPPVQTFDMRIENCRAKFVRPWRIRIRG